VRETDPGWDGGIAGLVGLSRRRPGLAAALVVLMLSLTGIPLTGGFWGKFLVFGAAVTSGWTWLALLGVVGSVVSFGYYGRVLRSAYLDGEESSSTGSETKDALAGEGAGPATGATVAVAVAIVLIGVAPLLTGLTPLLGVLTGSG
jgi:NADH-quinone oxidoreductase subunit N